MQTQPTLSFTAPRTQDKVTRNCWDSSLAIRNRKRGFLGYREISSKGIVKSKGRCTVQNWPTSCMPGMEANACSPDTLEAEANGLPWVQGQPRVPSELQSSFNYWIKLSQMIKEYSFPPGMVQRYTWTTKAFSQKSLGTPHQLLPSWQLAILKLNMKSWRCLCPFSMASVYFSLNQGGCPGAQRPCRD